jgi:hypothetical protein
MVDPLKDIVSACKSCHATDYQAKAQIYATTLGVTIGSSAAAPTTVAASQPSVSTTPAAAAAPAAVQAAVIPAANMVDYTQRYNESVLGQAPVNTGNIIAIVLIAALVLGGGFLVARREGWLNISFLDTKQIQATTQVKESFPADVVEMVPELVKLKPEARKDLRQILAKPATAEELFALVAKLIKPDDAPKPPEENGPKG